MLNGIAGMADFVFKPRLLRRGPPRPLGLGDKWDRDRALHVDFDLPPKRLNSNLHEQWSAPSNNMAPAFTGLGGLQNAAPYLSPTFMPENR